MYHGSRRGLLPGAMLIGFSTNLCFATACRSLNGEILAQFRDSQESKGEDFDFNSFDATLQTTILGNLLVYFPLLPSTQTLFEKANVDCLPNGAVFVAGEQTNGRGKGDARWIASKDSSLLFSVLLKQVSFDRTQNSQFLASLAVFDALSNAEKTAKLHLKAPNDIYKSLDDGCTAKIVGVLVSIHSSDAANGNDLIIGMLKFEICHFDFPRSRSRFIFGWVV